MTDLEELIGATLRRQAEHIPPPGPILAKLQRPTRRSRAKFGLLLAATTAVVAVAIMVTVQQLTVTSTPAPPGGLSPTPSPEPTVAPKTGPTLTYTAGWLPEGFTEFYRTIGEHGTQARSWAAGPINVDRSGSPNTPVITLALHTTAEPHWADTEDAIKAGANPVQIQGHPGTLNTLRDGDNARLIWMPDPNTALVVSLDNVPNTRQTAIKIAESVRADSTSTLQSEIKFGALPSPLQETWFSVIGKSPSDAGSEVMAGKPDAEDATTPTVKVTLNRQAPTQGSEPVTVRGRKGTYGAPVDRRNTEHNDFTAATVAVQLEDGRWLSLTASSVQVGQGNSFKDKPTPLTKEQLVAILDGIQFKPDPDYSWLGTR